MAELGKNTASDSNDEDEDEDEFWKTDGITDQSFMNMIAPRIVSKRTHHRRHSSIKDPFSPTLNDGSRHVKFSNYCNTWSAAGFKRKIRIHNRSSSDPEQEEEQSFSHLPTFLQPCQSSLASKNIRNYTIPGPDGSLSLDYADEKQVYSSSGDSSYSDTSSDDAEESSDSETADSGSISGSLSLENQTSQFSFTPQHHRRTNSYSLSHSSTSRSDESDIVYSPRGGIYKPKLSAWGKSRAKLRGIKVQSMDITSLKRLNVLKAKHALSPRALGAYSFNSSSDVFSDTPDSKENGTSSRDSLKRRPKLAIHGSLRGFNYSPKLKNRQTRSLPASPASSPIAAARAQRKFLSCASPPESPRTIIRHTQDDTALNSKSSKSSKKKEKSRLWSPLFSARRSLQPSSEIEKAHQNRLKAALKKEKKRTKREKKKKSKLKKLPKLRIKQRSGISTKLPIIERRLSESGKEQRLAIQHFMKTHSASHEDEASGGTKNNSSKSQLPRFPGHKYPISQPGTHPYTFSELKRIVLKHDCALQDWHIGGKQRILWKHGFRPETPDYSRCNWRRDGITSID